MWEGRTLRRADCVSGLGFVLLGVGVLYQASKIPMGGTYAGVDNSWYVSPAAFPLLMGGLFILSGLLIFRKGAREGGLSGIFGALKRGLARLLREPARRGVLAFALLLGYYVLLRLRLVPGWDGQNYIVSSTIFLTAFALSFFRPGGRFPRAKPIIGIVTVAALLSWGIAALFSGPLGVPLP